MKIILNVKKTPYAKIANKYGGLKIDGILYFYAHQHDALIQKVLYLKYKEHKNFEEFVKTYQDA
jgi:hypothetical protein